MLTAGTTHYYQVTAVTESDVGNYPQQRRGRSDPRRSRAQRAAASGSIT